jgi:hypothetical protein
MNREFFKIATARLSLFRPAPKPRALVRALADATGLSLLELMATERRMRTLQSFEPLRQLLDDKKLQERERLRYRMGIRRRRSGELTPLEQTASQMRLSIRTARGKVDVVARIEFARRILPASRKEESARIILLYAVRVGRKRQVYTQTLKLAGGSIAGRPEKKDQPRRWIAGILPRTQHA